MLNYTVEKKGSFELVMAMRTIDANDREGIRRFQSDYMRNGYQDFAFGQFGYRSPMRGNGTFRYGLGNVCKVENDGTYTVYFGEKNCRRLPDGFELKKVPAGTWAKFLAVGPVSSAVPETYERINAEWPEDLVRMDGDTLEEYGYGVGDSGNKELRTYIWVPVRMKEGASALNAPMYRFATIGDIDTVLGFVRELAEYEKSPESFVATPELLKEWMCDRKIVESQLVYLNGEAVGFALYFYNFSTWLGRGGIYIEDVYIRPAFRKHGIGRELFHRVAQKAVREGCGRMEWCCLEWNTPSLEFYRNIGAIRMDGWKTLRLTGDALRKLGTED